MRFKATALHFAGLCIALCLLTGCPDVIEKDCETDWTNYYPLNNGHYRESNLTTSWSNIFFRDWVQGTRDISGVECTRIVHTTNFANRSYSYVRWESDGLYLYACADSSDQITGTYSPPRLILPLILEPGEQMARDYVYQPSDSDQTADGTITIDFVGFETVIVPAGTFDCIHISWLSSESVISQTDKWYACGVGCVKSHVVGLMDATFLTDYGL